MANQSASRWVDRWRKALVRAHVTDTALRRTLTCDVLTGRAGALSVTVELSVVEQRSTRTDRTMSAAQPLPTLSIGVRVIIGGLGHHRNELLAGRAASERGTHSVGRGSRVTLGDSEFDGAVVLFGAETLARALFDAESRRAFRQLLSGELPAGEAQGGVDVVLRQDTLRVTGTARQLSRLEPALALARRLVRPPDLAVRIAQNTETEPLAPVRLGNLETLLAAFGEHPMTRAALEAGLRDPAEEVRFVAARALGSAGQRTLLGLAIGGRPQSRACESIALLGEALTARHARWLLRRAARDGRASVAAACVERLVALDDARSVSAVADALWDNDQKVAAATGARLAACGAPLFGDLLVRALAHPLREVQLAAAAGLVRVGTWQALRALEQWAAGHPDDRSLQEAAARAITVIRWRDAGCTAGQVSPVEPTAGQVTLVKEDERGRVTVAQDTERSAERLTPSALRPRLARAVPEPTEHRKPKTDD